MTTVVNKSKQPYDVYIGRGSRWGNPFVIDAPGTRAEVIALYRDWLVKQPSLMEQLEGLRGKRLGCFCKPLPCHGDVLVELLGEGVESPSDDQLELFGERHENE